MCLIPQTDDIVKKIPLVGAGGIYDSRTFAAALVLGAEWRAIVRVLWLPKNVKSMKITKNNHIGDR